MKGRISVNINSRVVAADHARRHVSHWCWCMTTQPWQRDLKDAAQGDRKECLISFASRGCLSVWQALLVPVCGCTRPQVLQPMLC